MLVHKNDADGLYLLGGTSSYLRNAISDVYAGGESENVQRTFSFNNRVDFDLQKITKGLAFHTNVSFDFYTRYDQSIYNTYSVYLPVWNVVSDSIVSLTPYGTDTRTGTQNIANSYFERRFGFYGMLDYDRTFAGLHHLTGSLLGYGSRYKIEGDFQGSKNLNLGLRVGYSYKSKYLLDFSSAYVNSVKLPAGNRGAFSPSLGLAWVISSENFMKAVPVSDYLKLKVSTGVLNSEVGIDGFYYYDNSYGNSGSYSWNEGIYTNYGTVSNQGGNSQLGFEKRNELNLGFEGILFNHHINIDANVFTSEYYDQITKPQTMYPGFYSTFIPYKNFDSNSYQGAELGLSYNKSFGDFSFVIGANALYATSKVVKRDELYVDKYQYRKGTTLDARFGLVADGFFMNQSEIDSHPIQAFGKVVPGDIKYVDQNNDGVIDTRDEVMIGRWQAPYSCGLNLKLAYKNITLFAQGNGRIGSDSYITNNYYWVDGGDKYSEYILNRWTEETKTTATLPRLTTLSSSNNYRSSTFWLYRDNYFTLDRVQLTYEMPQKVAGMLNMHQLSFHVNASNLFTISKYKNFRELNIGSEPQYRSCSVGVKAMF